MSFICRVSSPYPHTRGRGDGQPIVAKLAEEHQPGFEEVGGAVRQRGVRCSPGVCWSTDQHGHCGQPLRERRQGGELLPDAEDGGGLFFIPPKLVYRFVSSILRRVVCSRSVLRRSRELASPATHSNRRRSSADLYSS